ncbi:MAG: endolytic transglycosylase MltG [Dermatophilaceae bacterium]
MTTSERWEADQADIVEDQLVPTGRGRRPRRRARAARRFLVLVVTLGLVAGAALLALTVLRPMLSGLGESGDYPGPGSGAVTVTINEGDSGRAMGATLEKAGVVKSARAFVDAFQGEPKAAVIQPGEYDMRKEMKASDAVALLVDSANRKVALVTIREGLWASEVYAQLSQATGHPVSDYEAAAKDAAALGLPTSAKGAIEGYLFPASYEFSAKNSPAEQLRIMVGKAVSQLSRLGVSGEAAQRVMTIASIVEAEGRRPEDGPKIARVLENRLAASMRLQLDSTVSYVTRTRAVTTTDAQRATPSPWNTYLVDGLPPGPIDNPGTSAIQAAVAPASGPWLYFVAVNPATGETRFATTADEHAGNVAAFQAWCKANPGQC